MKLSGRLKSGGGELVVAYVTGATSPDSTGHISPMILGERNNRYVGELIQYRWIGRLHSKILLSYEFFTKIG